jgi:HNH endonuclease
VKVDQLCSKRDWFEAQHGFCWLCGTPMRFKFDNKDRFCATFDHLIPVSAGGTWKADNLLLAHQDCNNRRANRHHIFYLPPPQPRRVLTFEPATGQCFQRKWREIRPERASVHRAWTRQWLIDKGLMRP